MFFHAGSVRGDVDGLMFAPYSVEVRRVDECTQSQLLGRQRQESYYVGASTGNLMSVLIKTNEERNQEKFKNIMVIKDNSASFDFLYNKHQLFPRNLYFYIRLRKNKILNT